MLFFSLQILHTKSFKHKYLYPFINLYYLFVFKKMNSDSLIEKNNCAFLYNFFKYKHNNHFIKNDSKWRKTTRKKIIKISSKTVFFCHFMFFFFNIHYFVCHITLTTSRRILDETQFSLNSIIKRAKS